MKKMLALAVGAVVMLAATAADANQLVAKDILRTDDGKRG